MKLSSSRFRIKGHGRVSCGLSLALITVEYVSSKDLAGKGLLKM